MSRQAKQLLCQIQAMPYFVQCQEMSSNDLAAIALALANVHKEVINLLHAQNPQWPWAARHQTSNILQGGPSDDAA